MTPNATNQRAYRQRAYVLNCARALARSGQYADCASIIQELQAIEGFDRAQQWFEQQALRIQIDRLCAMSRRI